MHEDALPAGGDYEESTGQTLQEAPEQSGVGMLYFCRVF